MDNAVALASPSLDIETLLARVNQRIRLLGTWLAHDHADEPYWWARRTTAWRAQSEREVLRRIADMLHVERAHTRGRLLGRFANVDDQRAWLATRDQRACPTAASYAGVPNYATLALLRDGKLPL